MKENTERACKEFGAIHCVFPTGNAVVAATEVEDYCHVIVIIPPGRMLLPTILPGEALFTML